VFAEDGFRTRLRWKSEWVDARVILRAEGGAIVARLRAVDGVPLPPLKRLEERIEVPGIVVEEVTVSRTPRRVVLRGRSKEK
jgi:hypothetical protein